MVQSTSETVHVGQKGFTFTLNLFRRDIVRGPFSHRGGLRFGFDTSGEAEIYQLWLVVRIEKDIAGLDVPVQKVVLQGEIQRRSDADADIQHIQFGEMLLFFYPRIQ